MKNIAFSLLHSMHYGRPLTDTTVD